MNRYLVYFSFDNEPNEPVIISSYDLFDRMDLDDCYPIRIEALYFIGEREPEPCTFHGSWHDFNDPLKMTITKDSTGETLDVGYGSDH